jgi:hypothetical protein
MNYSQETAVMSLSSDDDDDLILAVCDAAVATATASATMINNIIAYQPMIYDQDPKWGGSYKGKRGNKKRGFDNAHKSVVRDYFSGKDSVYDEKTFETRFRVPRKIFIRIYYACLNTPPFIITQDGLGRPGIHPLVRVVACFRYLAYGTSLDNKDEYLRIAQSTVHHATRIFVQIVKAKFGGDYLNRNPTVVERDRILSFNKSRGFPGLFASWDCSHYKWDKCPVQDQGAY